MTKFVKMQTKNEDLEVVRNNISDSRVQLFRQQTF